MLKSNLPIGHGIIKIFDKLNLDLVKSKLKSIMYSLKLSYFINTFYDQFFLFKFHPWVLNINISRSRDAGGLFFSLSFYPYYENKDKGCS